MPSIPPDWADAISRAMRGDFGPPGKSLQQDIADELADHLSQSMDRERRSGKSEDEARERVLNRFGSPSQIAAGLWFDGMKGQIMFQRWMIGATALALLISIVTAGMAFWSIDQNNRSLLAAVDKLEERISASQSMDWVKARFKCIDADTGKPIEGASISLTGNLVSSSSDTLKVVTDADGTATLGPLKPGTHHLTLRPSPAWRTTEDLMILPGKDSEFVFTCPVEAPTQTSAIRFKLPPLLKGDDKAVQVDISLIRTIQKRVFNSTEQFDNSWYVTPGDKIFTRIHSGRDINLELRSIPIPLFAGEYEVKVSFFNARRPLQVGRIPDLYYLMPASTRSWNVQLTAKPDSVNDWDIVPTNLIPEKWTKDFAQTELVPSLPGTSPPQRKPTRDETELPGVPLPTEWLKKSKTPQNLRPRMPSDPIPMPKLERPSPPSDIPLPDLQLPKLESTSPRTTSKRSPE